MRCTEILPFPDATRAFRRLSEDRSMSNSQSKTVGASVARTRDGRFNLFVSDCGAAPQTFRGQFDSFCAASKHARERYGASIDLWNGIRDESQSWR
jgi:hypothetical protein